MSVRPIIVLGVDRSGTSMLTDVISRWGCYAGDPRLLAAPNPFNPQGFWEYKPVQQFMFELFDTTGVGWWNQDFRPALLELGRSSTHRQGAERLMAEMTAAAEGAPWIWKEPYFSISLPFWKQIWGNPVYVIIVRNPYRSALSYETFLIPADLHGKFRTIALFLLRWQFFMRCLLEDTAGANPLYLCYEELVSSPLEQCQRISAYLDRELGVTEVDEDKPRRMAERIDPKLWRQRSQLTLDEIPEASPEQRELYKYMMRKVAGTAEEPDLSLYPMPACWREYVHNIESLRQVLLQRGVTPNLAPQTIPDARPAAQAPAAPPVVPPRFPPRRREPDRPGQQ